MFVVRHAIGIFFKSMAISLEEYRRLQDACNREYKKQHHAEPEHDLQVACVKWFRAKYNNIKIWTNANGGKRDIKTASKMKAEGLLPGVPDLTIATARKGFHGFYIEMKNGKKNNPTEDQKEMIKYLRSQGYKAEVVRSFDEFVNVVTEYLKEDE